MKASKIIVAIVLIGGFVMLNLYHFKWGVRFALMTDFNTDDSAEENPFFAQEDVESCVRTAKSKEEMIRSAVRKVQESNGLATCSDVATSLIQELVDQNLASEYDPAEVISSKMAPDQPTGQPPLQLLGNSSATSRIQASSQNAQETTSITMSQVVQETTSKTVSVQDAQETTSAIESSQDAREATLTIESMQNVQETTSTTVSSQDAQETTSINESQVVEETAPKTVSLQDAQDAISTIESLQDVQNGTSMIASLQDVLDVTSTIESMQNVQETFSTTVLLQDAQEKISTIESSQDAHETTSTTMLLQDARETTSTTVMLQDAQDKTSIIKSLQNVQETTSTTVSTLDAQEKISIIESSQDAQDEISTIESMQNVQETTSTTVLWQDAQVETSIIESMQNVQETTSNTVSLQDAQETTSTIESLQNVQETMSTTEWSRDAQETTPTTASLQGGQQTTSTTVSLQDAQETTSIIESLQNAQETISTAESPNATEARDIPLYIITPTYRKAEQIPQLIRVSHALMQIENVHWLVIEDAKEANVQVTRFLERTGLKFDHLIAPMPEEYRLHPGAKPRGVSNRNRGLEWIRANATHGVLYFADDENTYDAPLFDEIRRTKRVSMFPVGLLASYGVSTPILENGKFIGFHHGYILDQKFAVDNAGYAVNVKFLLQRPNAIMPYTGFVADGFLKSLAPLEPTEIEFLADNCTKILVWHTRSVKNNPGTPLDMTIYRDTNIVELKKQIVKMLDPDQSTYGRVGS